MTDQEMIATLARAMEGPVGEALRMLLASKFGEAIDKLLEQDRDFHAGRMAALRDVTNALNAMPGTWKAIQTQNNGTLRKDPE